MNIICTANATVFMGRTNLRMQAQIIIQFDSARGPLRGLAVMPELVYATTSAVTGACPQY
ncbi:hypothetical protein GCM10011352_17000 [Marinobacterium zhoushanense]|uniref:Uncharacterized protein n=1 Tax=Marinobacterium zhoushanense TaxID=1679163 RepID=A0ABQ1KCN8_9GAMM|nr:hypothetical protein GCM10011352_17000 [Marinobacterium zhoushanense]